MTLLEQQAQHLVLYLQINFPDECADPETAIPIAMKLLRKLNTASNGGTRPKEKEVPTEMPMKYHAGKLLITTVIGAILTALLELAYDWKFKPAL